jgi:hypothetical protein
MHRVLRRKASGHPSTVKYRMIEALEGLDDALDRLRVRRAG